MAHFHEEQLKELEEKANEIRQTVIEMLVEAGSGHTAGPLGMADIFTAFYFHILNHKVDEPLWDDRDRLILSNGHIVPIRYATMAHAGYFSIDEAKTLRKFGSRMQGHPERERIPALESTSGPLGSGLSQAAGIAYGARMDGKKFRTYCLMSDGELDAGQSWEAILLAGKEKLHNLIAIIDRNNIQIDGYTEDIMPLDPLSDKWESFNWHVIEIDGHNFDNIHEGIGEAKAVYERPSVIIAHTIPGKGVREFMRKSEWHGKPPKGDEGKMALEELRSLRGQIDAGHMN